MIPSEHESLCQINEWVFKKDGGLRGSGSDSLTQEQSRKTSTYRYRHWHSRRHSSRTLDGVSPLVPVAEIDDLVLLPTCPVSAFIGHWLAVAAVVSLSKLDHRFRVIPIQLYLNFIMSPGWLAYVVAC